MFHPRSLAEHGLFSKTIPYRLRDTGQDLKLRQRPLGWCTRFSIMRKRASVAGLARPLSTWATTTCPMPPRSSVCPPFSLTQPGSKHCSLNPTCVPRTRRQVLTDLLYPLAHLQHILPAAGVQLARTTSLHRCGLWPA
jgi:hypothetical protein